MEGETLMTRAREMLDTHPGSAAMDTDALVECIDACFECAQTCTACADACLGEEMVEHMKRCITMCLNCSDVCVTDRGPIRSGGTLCRWASRAGVRREVSRRGCGDGLGRRYPSG